MRIGSKLGGGFGFVLTAKRVALRCGVKHRHNRHGHVTRAPLALNVQAGDVEGE